MQPLNGTQAIVLPGSPPGSLIHTETPAVLDLPAAPGSSGPHELRALFAVRARPLAPSTRRLVGIPLSLDPLTRSDDPHVDLDHQVDPIGVPGPSGSRVLGAPHVFLANYQHPRPLAIGRGPLPYVLMDKAAKRALRSKLHLDSRNSACPGAQGPP